MTPGSRSHDTTRTNARPRFETWWAALCVAALAVAFLWKPISQFGTVTFAPTDFLQVLPLTQVEPGWKPGNDLISDVAVEYHPWYLMDREEVARGRLPLWNRFNGFGVPHLGNFQSAVFSPLTVCYYLFSFKVAVLLTAFLKLFGLGFFTYLFLRRLRLAPIACLFGAAVYQFSAHNVLRLGYSQATVAMMVPAGLWAIERLAQAWEARLARGTSSTFLRLQLPGPTAVFAAVLVVGLLFGHPETFYFALMTMVVYAVARTIGLWSDHRGEAGATASLARLGAQLCVVGVLSAIVATVHLLPFFEYLSHSFIFGDRTGGGQTPLPLAAWPCHVFPNLLGNPSQGFFVDYTLPEPDFDTVTMAYVGALPLFLALLSVFVVRGRRMVAFWALAAVAWFFYAHDVWNASVLFDLVPTLKMVPINRSQIFFHVSIAVLSATFVDRCVTRRATWNPRGAALILGAAVVVLALFRAGALELVRETWVARASNSNIEFLPSGSATHVENMSLLFLAGAVAAASAWAARPRALRLAAGLACVLVAFAQEGWLFRNYNPCTPDAMVYPRTPLIEKLASELASHRALILGTSPIPPHVNSVYGIESIATWDGIDIRRFELLRRRYFDEGGNWKESRWADARGLQLFGIDTVLDTDRWVDVDTAMGFVEDRPHEEELSAPLIPGADVTFEFTPIDDRISGLRVWLDSDARPLDQTLVFQVEDATTGEHFVSATVEPGQLDSSHRTRVPLRLVLPRIDGAKERTLRLRLSSPDGKPESAWRLVLRKDYLWMVNLAMWRREGKLEPPEGRWHDGCEKWKAHQGIQELRPLPVLDQHFSLTRFAPGNNVGPYTVYRYLDAVPRFRTVTRAFVTHSEEESFSAVQRRSFVPAQVVVLEDLDGEGGLSDADTLLPSPNHDQDEPVRLIEEDHGRVHLATTRSRAGWLVIDQPFYPGWKATVNGRPTRIECANYAFCAVRLGAGDSDVVLTYEPGCVRYGAIASLLGSLVLVGWVLASRRALPA